MPFYKTEKGFITHKVEISNPPSEGVTYSDYSYGTGNWSRTSVRTPGYRKAFKTKKRVPKLDLPMNPFSFVNERVSFPSGTMITIQSDIPSGDYTRYTDFGMWNIDNLNVSKSSDVSSELTNQAIQQLRGKLRNSSVNLAVAAGEGKQTLNLFLSTTGRLTNAARALRRGNMSAAAAALSSSGGRAKSFNARRSLAENWLELQYGWMPLLSDMYGTLQFVADSLYRVPRSKVTSSAKTSESFFERVESDPSNRIDQWNWQHNVNYVLYFQESMGHMPSQLGLTNPLAVAWELVPWSFVVDWFLPIGSAIENLDATVGLDFVKGCKTEFWRANSIRTLDGITKVFGNSKSVYDWHLVQTLTKVACERSTLGGFPGPVLPSFRNPFPAGDTGKKRIANALALMSSAFR